MLFAERNSEGSFGPVFLPPARLDLARDHWSVIRVMWVDLDGRCRELGLSVCGGPYLLGAGYALVSHLLSQGNRKSSVMTVEGRLRRICFQPGERIPGSIRGYRHVGLSGSDLGWNLRASSCVLGRRRIIDPLQLLALRSRTIALAFLSPLTCQILRHLVTRVHG